ncbi:nuclear transport factor 2 family protein [Methylococcus sp. EFPC2]|uniref:nuclear transport factor 2 family protein n=1 Tax=Methylococcus sp. EFPC2 TaxID=2812648 RepID=UPI001967F0E2|nr:nuclear transport factor 2 family protein [Methylococcus sp. EFPC2]QSA98170.1 nuclear transport factor 2 family protein [Methylococcus sp. EFPC2]
MPAYPRAELQEMIDRWLAANRRAETEGDWIKHLGPMYAEDAEYSWNMGPNREFIARSRKEIEDWALGTHMEGFEKWRYPYEKILIDEEQGEVIGIWRQVAPVKRADGSDYEVAGVGGSWFRYGGDYRWQWQRDFFDLGNVKSMFMELAADDKLEPPVKHRLARLARGQQLPGVYPIHAKLGLARQLKGLLAMLRIVLLGK